MLGAIIGDIIGSRWEFNPTNDYHFELFSDNNDFTDDTICTIAVADHYSVINLLVKQFMHGAVVIPIQWVVMAEVFTSGS